MIAKYDERKGNSWHIYLSLRDAAGTLVFAAGQNSFSAVMKSFLAGQLACLREMSLLLALTVSSYKRSRSRGAATTDRSPDLLVGRGSSLRFENRLPGGDVNPYLAVAAMIAAGRYGVEHDLSLEAELIGSAYGSKCPRGPATLRKADEVFETSELAGARQGRRRALQPRRPSRVGRYGAAVADWEQRRGFERM